MIECVPYMPKDFDPGYYDVDELLEQMFKGSRIIEIRLGFGVVLYIYCERKLDK